MQGGFGEKHLDKPEKSCYSKKLWRQHGAGNIIKSNVQIKKCCRVQSLKSFHQVKNSTLTTKSKYGKINGAV